MLEASFLGYNLTQRQAEEIVALFTGNNLPDFIRNYCAAYES
jgi:hypothetical protein